MASELSGVTHNYHREHEYNLWFTLTTESLQRQQEILADVADRTGVKKFYPLPALAVYKIRVNFHLGDDVTGDSADTGAPAAVAALDSRVVEAGIIA